MLLPALLTADLHLTASPKDEYRWRLFDYLVDQCRAEQVKTMVILGDLTDSKDYHPSSLTNRIVREISRLSAVVDRVIILMGNHDYLRAGHAYFEFLSYLPKVEFVAESTDYVLDDGPAAIFLPHTKTPNKDWEGLDLTHYNYAFIHQTVGGAIASNGMAMTDEGVPKIVGPKVYSGDIHVPQVIREVEYVGSPYHVHFGDRFKPRLVLLDRRNRAVDLHFASVERTSIQVAGLRDLKRLELRPGDQVKLTVNLAPAEKHEWARIKREALKWLEAAEVEVHGINLVVEAANASTKALGASAPRITATDEEVVERFVRNDELGGDALEMGRELLK